MGTATGTVIDTAISTGLGRRRALLPWLTILAGLLIAAGCSSDGDGDGAEDGTGDTSSETSPDGSGTGSSDTGSSDTGPPAAGCTAEAFDVVRATLDPDGSIPGSVEVSECQNGYARVFYVPDSPQYEGEQVFLRDEDGQWVVLTFGTGIDCATETDFQPPELEDACIALGLRGTAAPGDGNGDGGPTADELESVLQAEVEAAYPVGPGAVDCQASGELTDWQPVLCSYLPDEPAEFGGIHVSVLDGGRYAWALGQCCGAAPWPGDYTGGLFCRDLVEPPADTAADHYPPESDHLTYGLAVFYWLAEDRPDRMDADRNGRPCETVYPGAEVDAFWGSTGTF